MAYDGSIQIEGIEQVCRAMREINPAVRKAVLDGMEAECRGIIADAQLNLRQNHSVVTGLLRQSGRVERNNFKEEIRAGFFDTENRQGGYAAFVEYGRRAGKFPPMEEIRQWLYKKFGIRDERELRSRAFLTARAIARQGTKPHPFFKPAVEKHRRSLLESIKRSMASAMGGGKI